MDRDKRLAMKATYISNTKNYTEQELEEEYIKLKEQEEIIKWKLQFIIKRILAKYPTIKEPIDLDRIKIIKSKRKILDQKKLKESIDITPYLKETEITIIQVKE